MRGKFLIVLGFFGLVALSGCLNTPTVNSAPSISLPPDFYQTLHDVNASCTNIIIPSCPLCPKAPDCIANCSSYCQPSANFQADHLDSQILSQSSFQISFEGASMQPFCWSGNSLEVVNYQDWMKTLLKEGNKVCFNDLNSQALNCHAIKSVYPSSDYFVSQGYNNSSNDGKVSYSKIKYVIKWCVPK